MTFSFPKELQKLLDADSFVGRTGKEIFPASGSTQSNLFSIMRLFKNQNPKTSLEVGLALGFSATLFTYLQRHLGSDAPNRHTAIDPYQSVIWDDAGELNVERSGLADHFRLIRQKSCIALPELINNGEKFDMIYVDGSHIFEDVFVDVYFCIRLLSDNGILLLDDSADKHVAKVIKFVRSSMKKSIIEVPPHEYRYAANFFSDFIYRIASSLNKTQLTVFRRIGEPERPWDAKFINF